MSSSDSDKLQNSLKSNDVFELIIGKEWNKDQKNTKTEVSKKINKDNDENSTKNNQIKISEMSSIDAIERSIRAEADLLQNKQSRIKIPSPIQVLKEVKVADPPAYGSWNTSTSNNSDNNDSRDSYNLTTLTQSTPQITFLPQSSNVSSHSSSYISENEQSSSQKNSKKSNRDNHDNSQTFIDLSESYHKQQSITKRAAISQNTSLMNPKNSKNSSKSKNTEKIEDQENIGNVLMPVTSKISTGITFASGEPIIPGAINPHEFNPFLDILNSSTVNQSIILNPQLPFLSNTTETFPNTNQRSQKSSHPSGSSLSIASIPLEDRPFRCPHPSKKDPTKQCSSAFLRQDELKRHIKIHNPIKPYKCQYCDMRFSRTDHLTTHTRTHTKEKPYECQYKDCNKKFARSDERLRHHAVHENRIKKMQIQQQQMVFMGQSSSGISSGLVQREDRSSAKKRKASKQIENQGNKKSKHI